jgi:hypothetical protein
VSYKCPKKHITKALKPIIYFRRYQVFDNVATNFTVLRATVIGAKNVALLKMLVNEQIISTIMVRMPVMDWKQWAMEKPTKIQVKVGTPVNSSWNRSGKTY